MPPQMITVICEGIFNARVGRGSDWRHLFSGRVHLEVTMTTQKTRTTGQVVAIIVGGAFLATNAFMNTSHLWDIGAGWDQLTAVLVVTIGTAVALTLAVGAWQEKRKLMSLAFVAAWVLGTSFSLSASLNRTSSTLSAHNTQVQTKNMGSTLANDALSDARRDFKSYTNDAARECATGIGPKCRSDRTKADAAQKRIDQARAQLLKSGAKAELDPAGAVLEALGIMSASKYALLQVLFLPFLLELGSVFLAYGFNNRPDAFKAELQALSDKEIALNWYRAQVSKGHSPKVIDLAARAKVHKSTASRWLKAA